MTMLVPKRELSVANVKYIDLNLSMETLVPKRDLPIANTKDFCGSGSHIGYYWVYNVMAAYIADRQLDISVRMHWAPPARWAGYEIRSL
jgi:hypothetical protein